MHSDTSGKIYDFDTIYQALPLGFVTMLSAELAARSRDVDAYEYICQEMPDEIKKDFCWIISAATSALERIIALKLTNLDDVAEKAGSVAWRARCDMWEIVGNWAQMSHDKHLLLDAARGCLR